MKLITFLVSLLMASSAFAAEAPFAWPENYSVTITEKYKFRSANPSQPFSMTFRHSGLNSRNDNDRYGTTIFRQGEKKIIRIARDGKIEESALPEGYSETVFPKNGTWTKLGTDTVNDQPSIKYSVSDASRTSYFWLSPDGKTPLRHEEGDMVIDFSNYSVGPQDAKLFQASAN